MSRYSMSVICDNCLIHLLNTIGFTMGQAADRDTQKLFFIENFQLKFITSRRGPMNYLPEGK